MEGDPLTLVRVGKLTARILADVASKREKRTDTEVSAKAVEAHSSSDMNQRATGGIAGDVAGFPAIEEGHELDLQR